MKQLIFLISLFFSVALQAQFKISITIKDKTTLEPLKGVTAIVKGISKHAISDSNGIAEFQNMSGGLAAVVLSYVGYTSVSRELKIPGATAFIIFMEKEEHSLEDVIVVSSTRNNDRIETSTTKAEVLGQEEMNEESTLKPNNIASLLGDVSGVQIQQSSLSSGNSNVRIQGLDGKYTQILRDGMPLYGGYSGGFGVLTIPPLDLKQVELIKGSSSTLYGGGAIAGLVNLISKKTTYEPDASFLINQTTLKETNINAYYARRWRKVGFTVFAGQNLQQPVDVNKDGFSDMPSLSSILVHPVLFFYPSGKSYVSLGWSGSFENRKGGDMIAIQDKPDVTHTYFENNRLDRNLFTLIAENKFEQNLTATIKASISHFTRNENTNTYNFTGKQINYYTEVSASKIAGKHNIVTGLNITGDEFKPSLQTPVPVGNFRNSTAGLFVQDTWKLLQSTKLEAGIRLDKHNKYGTFVLPRFALFQHISKAWGARLGFGMGYNTPNPLTPQVMDYSIYQLQPIADNTIAEKSYGGNVEVNYKKEWDNKHSFFLNHAFFITQINNPLVGAADAIGKVYFANQPKPLVTKGFDTYIQVHAARWEAYVGYTYTDAKRTYLAQNRFVLYTPKHRAAATLLYEMEGNFRIGIEASYNGYQYREDNSRTPSYLFMAAMAEKKFGPQWSLVLNCENLFDERQSRHESLYTGSIINPAFKTLWAPVDGCVFNLCLRFKPFAKD